MYEVNLCCPICGTFEFEATEDGLWLCPDCGWIGPTADLEPLALETE